MTGSALCRVTPTDTGRLHVVRKRGILLSVYSVSKCTRKAEQTVDVKIIVATHKKYRMPVDEMYLPVHVGAVGNETISGCQRDDEGENISALNPYFCELTGLYWAWKNLEADYIGLVHYRRHFLRRFCGKGLRGAVLKKRILRKILAGSKCSYQRSAGTGSSLCTVIMNILIRAFILMKQGALSEKGIRSILNHLIKR